MKLPRMDPLAIALVTVLAFMVAWWLFEWSNR